MQIIGFRNTDYSLTLQFSSFLHEDFVSLKASVRIVDACPHASLENPLHFQVHYF